MELTRIPLHEKHVALGAKMVSFGGFEMPVRYTSDVEEHLCVRQGVGIFDVSHMGEFLVTGPHALELIQYVTSNDASQLSPGKVQYSCFPNENGGIVDDLLVYKFDDEKYLLVVNASNIGKDWDWVKKHNTFGAHLEDISKKTCLFAVQGPKAADALQSLTSVNLAAMTYYTFEAATFANVKEV
ncbi:MAG TPA: glycine cleavage system aminomethyltransferase GcvT, partial [Cytophagales bacterium]|nr:glycine cleavage system aminomethyltransferase GcvT [Cytophagales bacterium]